MANDWITVTELLKVTEDICLLEAELIELHKRRIECISQLKEATRNKNKARQMALVHMWVELWGQVATTTTQMELIARNVLMPTNKVPKAAHPEAN